MFFRRSIPRVSDEDHIERIRKMVRLWDAWKPWVLVGSVAILIVFVVFLNWLFSLFADLEPSDPFFSLNVSRMWLLVAFILGAQVGMSVYQWLAYVVETIAGGYRTERLLLKMCDANAVVNYENGERQFLIGENQ